MYNSVEMYTQTRRPPQKSILARWDVDSPGARINRRSASKPEARSGVERGTEAVRVSGRRSAAAAASPCLTRCPVTELHQVVPSRGRRHARGQPALHPG